MSGTSLFKISYCSPIFKGNTMLSSGISESSGSILLYTGSHYQVKQWLFEHNHCETGQSLITEMAPNRKLSQPVWTCCWTKECSGFQAGQSGCTRYCHNTQNDTQLKTYELLISGIFLIIFSNHC